MKKILMMAAFAAAGAAFTACSSDDTLATQQTPEAPVVKGTPFKVSAFAEGTTRATRYNADAWNGGNSTTWVKKFKLYGQQGDNDPWMDDIVFSRTAYDDADWTPSDPDIAWRPNDPNTETSFYAITDGDNTLTGVSNWMSTVGKFNYSMPTLTAEIDWIDETEGLNGYFKEVSTYYVDASKLTDLMVANAEKKESETTSGVLNLSFSHILSGLTIKIKFLNDGSVNKNATEINSIKVCGLKTSGTYSFGVDPDTTPWALTTYTCYYKKFDDPILVNAQLEATEDEDATYTELVAPGEWMVIPQKTEPWNAGYLDQVEIPEGQAYIALRIKDGATGDEVELYYPLNTTFSAAKNKVLKINLGAFYDAYDTDENDDTKAALYYKPSGAGGTGAAPAMIIEDF